MRAMGSKDTDSEAGRQKGVQRRLTLFDRNEHAGIAGWRPVPHETADIRANPRGFAAAWVTVPIAAKPSNAGEPPSPAFVPGYEQPLLIEDLGAIVIATDAQGRVALVENYRFIGPRLADAPPSGYVRSILERDRWKELAESLGTWNLECPRGMLDANKLATPPKAGDDLGAFIKGVARVEGLEEGGLELEDLRFAGWMNTNTTFFAHPQAVVEARIVRINKQDPEAFEHIGALHLLSPSELRARIDASTFIDGVTLAGLSICGIHVPQGARGPTDR